MRTLTSRSAACAMLMIVLTSIVKAEDAEKAMPAGYTIPIVDVSAQRFRQTTVDIEEGQYLGHPTTVLLEDGATMIAVYPKGHGKGAIIMKRSDNGGRSWSQRLPTPKSWETSKETPTIHRMIDPRDGTKRLVMFSGLYPIRMAHSEDDGATWTELEPIGDYGGIVAMGCAERMANGDYIAMFHDDGRFFTKDGKVTKTFRLYQVRSSDGGLTWGEPEEIWSGSDVHLCEPGMIRSPDGKTLAILLRENRRVRNSHVMFSTDEAETWSEPRELPGALTGDRHTAKYAPDGRLFISFRDTTRESPTQGDWCGWVGAWEDIVEGREGQYRVRLMDNRHRWDCAYPGVEVLPDGMFSVTTYGHWRENAPPYIMNVRFRLEELDAMAKSSPPGSMKLVFEDEFNGEALDEEKWTPRDPWERGRNNELQAYAPEAFSLKDGILHVTAERKSAEYAGAEREYISGMMNSKGKFYQRYGRFEIRCRAPRGKGLWPAFWLLPDGEKKGLYAEIDVLEILGDRPRVAYFTHHWKDEAGERGKEGGHFAGPDFTRAFHTYAMDWTPEAIVWSVNGVERARSSSFVPQDRPMFMLVNLAVGGDWPGAPNVQTRFPAAFEVDYIRVYEFDLDDDTPADEVETDQ
jgi:beta-glucanase (GH16 family)